MASIRITNSKDDINYDGIPLITKIQHFINLHILIKSFNCRKLMNEPNS